MKLGVYTAILHNKPLREALEVIASLGLSGAEINAGGFLPAPHLPVDDLLSGAVTPDDYLANFDGPDVSVAGLNCNGNPLHPDPEVGPEDADDLRRAIRVAGLLGVDRVVTMAGLPRAHLSGQWPAWHVNTWDSGYLDALDYQWNELALPFWSEIDALARHNGVKVAIEMHPQNLVFNCKIYGVLDDRFTRIPLSEHPTGLGGRHVVNKWPEDSAWDFVAVGRGHDTQFWARFLQALERVDPNTAVNIEHEDVELGQVEGLEVAETLKAANSATVN